MIFCGFYFLSSQVVSVNFFPFFLNLFYPILSRRCNYETEQEWMKGCFWLSFFFFTYIFLVFYVLYLCAFCKLKYAICASVASSGS